MTTGTDVCLQSPWADMTVILSFRSANTDMMARSGHYAFKGSKDPAQSY